MFWSFFFLCVEGTRTARPSRRRGKQQPGGLLFSARGSPSGNVYCGRCGSKDFLAFCFVSHGCTVGVFHVRLCRVLYCIAIGFRCPLVLAALLEQPVHQELCHRHRGRRPSTAMPIRASFCRRTGACRSLSQPLFRISRNQGVTHWTLQAKLCANERFAALWILPGRALENGDALLSAASSSPRTKNGPQVLLDNSQNKDYHNHEMNIMFMTIYSI